MGKQVNLFGGDVNDPSPQQPRREYISPKEFVPREAFEPFDIERAPEPRDEMRVIGRYGQVKVVRFLVVNEANAMISWPISNDVIEVSLKTGDLKIKRGEKLWRLEPAALKACRRLRNAKRGKLCLLPEDD